MLAANWVLVCRQLTWKLKWSLNFHLSIHHSNIRIRWRHFLLHLHSQYLLLSILTECQEDLPLIDEWKPLCQIKTQKQNPTKTKEQKQWLRVIHHSRKHEKHMNNSKGDFEYQYSRYTIFRKSSCETWIVQNWQRNRYKRGKVKAKNDTKQRRVWIEMTGGRWMSGWDWDDWR